MVAPFLFPDHPLNNSYLCQSSHGSSLPLGFAVGFPTLATQQLLNAVCPFLNGNSCMTRSHGGLVLQLGSREPTLTNDQRETAQTHPRQRWEGKAIPDPEMLRPQQHRPPATISTPWETAGLGQENISLCLLSTQQNHHYKIPTVYWALKQYLASREKSQQTVRDGRTWRMRQWKQTETSWQHTPN